MKDATFKPTVLYLIALIICGSNGIVASLINLPSYQIVFFRMLLGTLFLLTVKFVQKEAFTIQKYPKDFQALIGSGIALGLQWTFLFEAYQLVGVGIATLEYYCGPVIVMALTPFLFGEKFTTKKITWLPCSCNWSCFNYWLWSWTEPLAHWPSFRRSICCFICHYGDL